MGVGSSGRGERCPSRGPVRERFNLRSVDVGGRVWTDIDTEVSGTTTDDSGPPIHVTGGDLTGATLPTWASGKMLGGCDTSVCVPGVDGPGSLTQRYLQ